MSHFDAPLGKLIGLVFNPCDLGVYVCAYMNRKNREGRGESVLSTEAFINTLITSQLYEHSHQCIQFLCVMMTLDLY